MSDPLQKWSAMDEYFASHLLPHDPIQEATLSHSHNAHLPPGAVSPLQGQFLMLITRIQRAKYILELGTLGGYSAIWFARGISLNDIDLQKHQKPILTLESNPHNAKIAQENISQAGLSHLIDIRLGPALETLPKIASESRPPFDLIFLDADKKSNPEYFEWALKLSHPGSVIIADNVVRNGKVLDKDESDVNVVGVRKFMEMVGKEKRVTGSVIQTVGCKGYDGFALLVVNGVAKL